MRPEMPVGPVHGALRELRRRLRIEDDPSLRTPPRAPRPGRRSRARAEPGAAVACRRRRDVEAGQLGAPDDRLRRNREARRRRRAARQPGPREHSGTAATLAGRSRRNSSVGRRVDGGAVPAHQRRGRRRGRHFDQKRIARPMRPAAPCGTAALTRSAAGSYSVSRGARHRHVVDHHRHVGDDAVVGRLDRIEARLRGFAGGRVGWRLRPVCLELRLGPVERSLLM